MSNSIAAAKRRRAGIQSSTSTPPAPPQQTQAPQTQQTQPPQRMTATAYLSALENRLVSLEKSVDANNIQLEMETPEGKKSVPITEYMEEMDAKFQMMAEEITNMKDVVLKLQSFTMDVNQQLLEKANVTPKKAVTAEPKTPMKKPSNVVSPPKEMIGEPA